MDLIGSDNHYTEKSLNELLKSDLLRIYRYKNEELKADGIRLSLIIFKYFIIARSFRAIWCYRYINRRYRGGKGLNNLLEMFSSLINSVVIPHTAEVDEGLFLHHPQCIIINPKVKIGKDATIFHEVTIGGNVGKTTNGGRGAPIIGDNVLLSAGAKILGPISVGHNSIIGANAVVIEDVPDNSVVVGVPGKVVKQVEEPLE